MDPTLSEDLFPTVTNSPFDAILRARLMPCEVRP